MADPRMNFKWGNGVNSSNSYDPNAQNGNTNSWTDADWAAYDKVNGAAAPTASVEGGGGVQGSTDPNPYVSNPTDQKTFRDALIGQMTQNPIPDVKDPAIAAQANPLEAQIERSQRDQVRQEAERGFASGQDYGSPERMMAAEHAGQQKGLLESTLVGRELQSRRDQIADALHTYAGMMSGDQQRQLQEKLANLDAQLRREGLNVQNTLGQGDLSLRRDMGTGNLNLGLLGLLFNNQQGNDRMSLDAALAQAGLNRSALTSLLG